jgi:hypothetical protein
MSPRNAPQLLKVVRDGNFELVNALSARVPGRYSSTRGLELIPEPYDR